MALKIAILEDNLERQQAMKAWLNDRLYMYDHVFFDESAPMITWLQTFLPETLILSLDHDLELKPTGDGRWLDPGTGREVADFLALHEAHCPVIVHSTNAPAADGMDVALRARGWHVELVKPYGDLAWVDEAWWPAIKQNLRLVSTERHLAG
ncbi:cyclic-phosphate processing receiver domain-containing protein [Anatilimnocola sp. NA78]|uniref:cyclic-phosphate processing receiver domain-containing protein n=1 Tax=Anatilimnocola sp. NA78 TaxID=3415683 RepID=UPI003CE4C8E7